MKLTRPQFIVPLVDKDGRITREWVRMFEALFVRAGATDGPSTDEALAAAEQAKAAAKQASELAAMSLLHGSLDGEDGARGPQGEPGPPGPAGGGADAGMLAAFLLSDSSVDDVMPPMPDGSIGAPGPQGPQGQAGPQGPQGWPGDDGLDGKDGFDGLPGPQGVPGPVGPQGPQGIQGEEGPEGPQGPPGLDGARGPQGVPGTSASSDGIGSLAWLLAPDYLSDGDQMPQMPGLKGDTGPQGPQGIPGTSGGGSSLALLMAPDPVDFQEPYMPMLGTQDRATAHPSLKGWQFLGSATGATVTVGPVIWTGTYQQIFFQYVITGYSGGTPVGRVLCGAASISTTALTNGNKLISDVTTNATSVSVPGCPLAVTLSNIARSGYGYIMGASGALKQIHIHGVNGTPAVATSPTSFLANSFFSDLGTNLPIQRLQLTSYDTLVATAASVNTFTAGTTLWVWGRNND